MNLKLGSTGDDVIKLQTALGLKADGDFGPKTEAAIKKFQTEHGLKSDGVVGNTTWDKIFNISPPDTGVLNLSKLKGVIPDNVYEQMADTVSKFNITTNLRLAHFLSQCAHESGGFKIATENLNYSYKGLMITFKKYFNTTNALEYAKKPEKIGSKVYASRMGNGDESSKEGYKFRGRGYIQLTGKSNYISFGNFINENIIDDPDLVATKYPLASAAFFFNSNKIWNICDKGSTEDVVKKVTKSVNGGYIGLDDRQKYFDKFWNILK